MRTFTVSIAMLASVVLAPAAFGEPGQNGPPGPEGNPNQPAAPDPGPPTTPPGNSGSNPHGGPPGITGSEPQTPASGSQGNGPSHPTPNPSSNGAEHAAPNSAAAGGSRGSSGTPQGPPADVPVANGSDGTTPAGGGPDGQITICHSTGSETNPFVEITISVNGLNGHGGHHDGADIVPAPAGGCEGVSPATTTATAAGGKAADGGSGNALGTRRAGGPRFSPGVGLSGTFGVLSASASGSTELVSDSTATDASGPGAADADGTADGLDGGQLPFTGLMVGGLALCGLLALAGGIALWRVSRSQPDTV